MTKTLSQMIQRAKDNESKPSKVPHIVVNALAGTGKTTTGIEGLNVLFGRKTNITPSPQQKEIWKALQMERPSTVAMTAFNKAIATELQMKVPNNVTASTLHSLGFSACRKLGKRIKVNKWKVDNMIEEHTGKDIRELRKDKPVVIQAVKRLTSLCKMTLTDPTPDELAILSGRFGVDTNGRSDEIFEMIPDILELCRTHVKEIDFDDMIWLPVINQLPVFKNDLLFVDEAQDLNRCQQELALLAGKRLCLVGDVNQAIYGFAGADCDSIPNMVKVLEDRGGCLELPLTVTRRCGRAIVRDAQEIVPAYEAHESNGEGLVDTSDAESIINDAVAGDMILCRTNAPLVRTCFAMIKARKKANIQGRDIGDGLIALVKRLSKDDKCSTVSDLMVSVDDWHQRESMKLAKLRNPPDDVLVALSDKKDVLFQFCENTKTLKDVTNNIKDMFADGCKDGVLLSSIHRAKGLEADHVHILHPELLPHPMAKQDWAKEQERNLDYVARTRAAKHLTRLQ